MRGSLQGVRRPRGDSAQPFSLHPLQAAAALGLGLTLGIVGMLLVAPLGVFAGENFHRPSWTPQDAYAVSDRYVRARAPVYARYRERPLQFRDFFQPIVHSFAPQPRFEPRTAPPLVYGHGQRLLRELAPLQERLRASGERLQSTPQRTIVRKAASANRNALRPAIASQLALQSRRTVCVRLCDGYYFPLGNLHSTSDLPTHEAMCQAACPASPVRVFTMNPAAPIERAVSREMRSYASLPTAFLYRTSRTASCACQRQGEPQRISLLQDPTMRPGDAVVTGQRAQVFEGSSSWPYRLSDFKDFRSSRWLSAAQRRTIDALVGVSYTANLLKPYTVARADRRAPIAAIDVVRPQINAEAVRRIDGANGRLLAGRAIVALDGSTRSIRIVEQRSVAGFVLR